MSRRLAVPAAALLAGLGLGVPAQAVSVPERTARVSSAPGGQAAAGVSSRPAITAGGRLVAFESTAPDLGPADPNGAVRDVFARDLLSGAVRLVSAGLGGAGADGPSGAPAVGGADLVAFVSDATNLVAGDRNAEADVFLRAGDEPVARVSVAPGGAEADGRSSQPDLSRGGETLVFTSEATNLVPGDLNRASDVFALDLDTGAIRRVSAPRDGEATGASFNPAVSPDGRWVSFSSLASNLVPGDGNDRADVFLADLRTGRIERVSVSSRRRSQNRAVIAPFTQVSDVSERGRYVVFDSDATNLVPRDRNRDTDVFVRDRRTRTTRRASVTSTGREATNDSFNPTLTPSGRHVAFESFAEDLAPGDAPREDVFVRDLRRRLTVVVGVTSRGAAPRGPERVRQLLQRPVLSDDATAVAFTSTAGNLAPGDGNAAEDVYVRDLRPPRGGFARAPDAVERTRKPTVRFVADDPAARLFLCSLDGARRVCGLRTRLPRLRAGRHVLRVTAGGPGMLHAPEVSTRRFRVVP